MSVHASKRWIWSSNCADFPGNEPPFGKILAYDSRIEGIYVNGTPRADQQTFHFEDPFVTASMMTRIRSFGLLAGAWFVPRTSNAAAEAFKASNMVTLLNPDCVMLDVETHDLNFQRAFVAEYRRLKPGRATDVTFEPRQDLTTVAGREYVAARMDLFPQLYNDRMRPSDPKHELDVWAAMFGYERVHLFLNAAQDWWALDDGALFTAETLPDKRALRSRTLDRAARTLRMEFAPHPLTVPVEPCGEEPLEQAA
jgi:hypothetical protein